MRWKKSFISTMPKRSLAIFLLGVFFLFGTMGLAGDVAHLGQEPALRLILTIVTGGIFAIFYATAGFALRGESWKAMIPIVAVHSLVMSFLTNWQPLRELPAELNAERLAALHSRLNTDAVAIMAAMSLGYVCFVYASITEGRRYFRAHAEIALVQEIHRVLVPTIDKKMGRHEFYGFSSPSGEVGGDLIDLAGTDEKWVAYLADVSGHGVAPGLVMGMVKSASRMLLSSGEGSERLMARLNEVLYPLKKPDMFATFGFVAASGNRVRVGLAGHPSLLQFSPATGEVTEIECPNMPLGILAEGEFVTSEVEAETGTVFALYSDGFLEAANAAGEEFGVKRLRAELQRNGREPLQSISRSIRESVARHGAQFDDQSILLIRI